MIVSLKSHPFKKEVENIRKLYEEENHIVILTPQGITEYQNRCDPHYIEEASIEFNAKMELAPAPKNKAEEIVKLFESITDEGDIQFLKRYFEIKLK